LSADERKKRTDLMAAISAHSVMDAIVSEPLASAMG